MGYEKIVRAQRTIYRDTIDILLGIKNVDGSFDSAKPLEYKRREMGSVYEPTMSISFTEAQMLMDELWNCGLRPSEGSGSAGALAATERHLLDMQKLTFMLMRPSISPHPSQDKSDQQIAP